MSSYNDPGQHIFWLGSRGFGVVALALAAISVGLGLAMSSRVLGSAAATGRVKQLHEAVSLSALVAIVAHGGLLLGDAYLRPGLTGIAIPFAIHSRPLWNAFGIVAGWLALIFGLSFYVRKRIGTKLWRSLHRWTVLVYGFGVVHTLGAGTDAAALWLIGLLVAAAAPILVLCAYRYLPEERIQNPPGVV